MCTVQNFTSFTFLRYPPFQFFSFIFLGAFDNYQTYVQDHEVQLVVDDSDDIVIEDSDHCDEVVILQEKKNLPLGTQKPLQWFASGFRIILTVPFFDQNLKKYILSVTSSKITFSSNNFNLRIKKKLYLCKITFSLIIFL